MICHHCRKSNSTVNINKKIKQIGTIGLLGLASISDQPFPEKMASFIQQRGVDPHQYQNVIYHNESEFLLNRYIKKKAYYAKSFEHYIKKWSKKDRDLKKQLGFWYRYFGVFLENACSREPS